MTREHLFPQGLHSRIKAANKTTKSRFLMLNRKNPITSQPTVKDVCDTCNNGPLSQLDDYICRMFDSYFVDLRERGDSVSFLYDYHMLKRWILKISYNFARVYKSEDLEAYPHLIPYIIETAKDNGKTSMFVQINYPGVIPKHLKIDANGSDRYLLTFNRVSLINYRGKPMRVVHLRSFAFYIAFWHPDELQEIIDEFSNRFCKTMPGMYSLSAEKTRADLQCDGYSSIQIISTLQ